MTSSRLPGKVMLPVVGKPMLEHLFCRLQAVPSLDGIVLATTTNPVDDVLVTLADHLGIMVFRGSEENVLERVIGAAEIAKADVVVEITGDCPIIDPDIVEQTIQMFLHHEVDYVSNCDIRSYPDGMDTQVFSLDVLKRSAAMTRDRLDQEHVTLPIRRHPNIFSKVHLIAPPSLYWPDLGLTLDEKDDYLFIKMIFDEIGDENVLFGCGDILNLLRHKPELLAINREVRRKGDA